MSTQHGAQYVGENMILCEAEADHSASMEFSMQNVITVMEELSQAMDMGEEDAIDGHFSGSIKNFNGY